ncbi:BEN domain-containing protein 5 [Frankliniella fusca]|uniref:BEN domain-containing protein 5 n=1 Tax=Frankliniella fusca TaxID=407009 RepID=A0AAE1GSX5_9NEOP|nr:BEN domain-containing protein 5 [Frankliniella fusca]
MSKLTLAFVNFFKEKSGSRKIVRISEFDDGLSPAHHSDFDENRTYLVKWPHLPVEGSSSTVGLYEAKVLCLGVDLDDLKKESKTIGVKITHSMIKDFETRDGEKQSKVDQKTPRKSSRGRPIKKSVSALEKAADGSADRAAPDPRMVKKKKKVLAEEASRDKRQQKTLANYDDQMLFRSDVPRSSNMKSQQQDSATDSESANSKQTTTALPIKAPETDLTPVKHSSGKPTCLNSLGDQSFKFSPLGKFLNTGDDYCNEDSKERPVIVKCEPLPTLTESSSETLVIKTPSHSPQVKHQATHPVKCDSSTSNSQSSEQSCSEQSETDAEKELYYNKMRKLELELIQEKSKTRSLQNTLESLEETVKTQQRTINELKEDSQRYSKVNLRLTEKLVNALSTNSDTGNSKVIRSIQFESPAKGFSLSAKRSDSMLSLPEQPEDFEIESPVLAGKKHKKYDKTPSPAKLENESSATKKHKSDGSPSKKRKRSDIDEDDVTSNDELGQMILLALQSKAPLQCDGDGKVHIGNGVWISEKSWNEKIRKATVSPSIALRDAMANVYSSSEMAERSLEGGTPVKAGPDGVKIKKKKMTPHKREAFLGLFRGKTAASSGSTDKCFLDLSVSKKGRDTIKYKLKEASIDKNGKSKSSSQKSPASGSKSSSSKK